MQKRAERRLIRDCSGYADVWHIRFAVFVRRFSKQVSENTGGTSMLGNCMDKVRAAAPLVHNITNYVTVNDVANILLACGGSPIMSD